MIRVILPAHLRTLAGSGKEVELEVAAPVTQGSVLDALEAAYPTLRGTIRDQGTRQRRPLVRFFACQRDLSHEAIDAPLPEEVVSGREPYLIVGAMAGGEGAAFTVGLATQASGGGRMKYMLLIYGSEQVLSPEERDACYVESAGLARELAEAGVFRGASPLHPVATATSVQVRDGKQLITDGPFAETREQLGGYYIVDTGDLDEAVAIAARIPGAKWGTVEIRPILEIDGLPEQT